MKDCQIGFRFILLMSFIVFFLSPAFAMDRNAQKNQ